MLKKITSVFLLLFITAAALTGCGDKGESESDGKLISVKVSEAAHSALYAPQYAAELKGYFEEEGLKVEWIDTAGTDKAAASILSGDTDIALMGGEASVYAYVEGKNDYIVNFAQLTKRSGDWLIGKEDIKNFDWDKLKGKKVVGGRQSGMPEMVFEYILKKNGIDPDRDLFIDKTGASLSEKDGFANGEADFMITANPYAAGDSIYVEAWLGKDSGDIPYTVYAAKKSYVNKRGDVLQSFVNAVHKGMDYVNSNNAEDIAKLIEKDFPDTDIKQLTEIIEQYKKQGVWKENLTFEENSFIMLENIIEEAGGTKERVPYDKLVTVEFTKRIQ